MIAASSGRATPAAHQAPLLLAGMALLALLTGCSQISAISCPGKRLSFPAKPIKVTPEGRYYDVDGDGRADFAILYDESGRLNVLAYDDDQDGKFDRFYRLSDYNPAEVPHLIVLMDSLPYRLVSARYQAGDWHWFYPPQKVIAPFPSMSITTFNEILEGPPLPGFFERYYDRAKRAFRNQSMDQVFGYRFPWHRRTDFVAPYWNVGMMYLNPRPWFGYELTCAKQAFDESPNKVSVVYVVSSSGMISRHGEQGAVEVLDEIERLCMQVLYERRGAVKITIVSDHGHNLAASSFVTMDDTLRAAGFTPRDNELKDSHDVAIEIAGLVTCFGVHTRLPAEVAGVLLRERQEIQLALYQSEHRVIVRSRAGSAAIERRGERFRYVPIDCDVLGYQGVLDGLTAAGKLDKDGFAGDRDWLLATANHEYPDVPRRAWDAFHGLAVNAPDVQFVLKDGYCAGSAFYSRFVTVASTHGGLNQINSDAVIMTMTRPLDGPMRSREIMPAIEPRYVPTLPPRVDRE